VLYSEPFVILSDHFFDQPQKEKNKQKNMNKNVVAISRTCHTYDIFTFACNFFIVLNNQHHVDSDPQGNSFSS